MTIYLSFLPIPDFLQAEAFASYAGSHHQGGREHPGALTQYPVAQGGTI